MRVLVVGSPAERSVLRQRAAATALVVVAEYSTIGEARSSRVRAEAILLGARGAEADGAEEALAARLGISDQTVKFHVAAICGKLGAKNRTDVVRRAIRRGVVAI